MGRKHHVSPRQYLKTSSVGAVAARLRDVRAKELAAADANQHDGQRALLGRRSLLKLSETLDAGTEGH